MSWLTLLIGPAVIAAVVGAVLAYFFNRRVERLKTELAAQLATHTADADYGKQERIKRDEYVAAQSSALLRAYKLVFEDDREPQENLRLADDLVMEPFHSGQQLISEEGRAMMREVHAFLTTGKRTRSSRRAFYDLVQRTIETLQRG